MEIRVGQRFKVRSIEWYQSTSDSNGNIVTSPGFVSGMSSFCGKIVTVSELLGRDKFNIKEDDGRYIWGDWMFEECFSDTQDSSVIFLSKEKQLPYIMTALQGILANPDYTNMSDDDMTKRAISIVTTLLKNLNYGD